MQHSPFCHATKRLFQVFQHNDKLIEPHLSGDLGCGRFIEVFFVPQSLFSTWMPQMSS